MLKIAICDDEPQAAAQEEAIVRDSLRACGVAGEVTRYTQSQTLLDDLTDDGFFYDLLLLDIEMPGLDGMEMARRCREILPKVRIIFVTSHREYAIDAFELSIFRYVPKSDRETRLAAAVTDAAKLYHDLHNHIEVLCHCLDEGDLGAARRYCQDLRGPVEEMAHTVWTGDPAVDHLITSKTAQAQALGAQTQVNVEFPRNTDIRGVDLTAILGNLLDNALEALAAAPADRRLLRLTIRRIQQTLIIKVENSYGQAPRRDQGALVSAKKDRTRHGWGLKSVQAAAERYEGVLQTDWADGVFRAVVTLSFQPVKLP